MDPRMSSKVTPSATVLVTAFILLSITPLAQAFTPAPVTLPPSPTATIESQIHQLTPPTSSFALVLQRIEPANIVGDTHTDIPQLSINADTLMLPASTQKLLVAAAALKELGSDYRFTTSLYRRGKVTQGVLHGDLLFAFDGDPTLSRTQLASLLEQAKQSGINKVQGDVLLLGQPQRLSRASGWAWDDLGICYSAPVSSYMIDGNCVRGKLLPAKQTSSTPLSPKTPANIPAIVDLPANAHLTVNSSAYFVPNVVENTAKAAQTVKANEADGRHYSVAKSRLAPWSSFCQLSLQSSGSNQYQLSGCFSPVRSLPLAIAVNDANAYAQSVVSQLLSATGITLRGKIKLQPLSNNPPNGLIPMNTVTSLPTVDLVHTMLLRSDNLIADALLFKLAEQYYGPQAGFPQGVAAMTAVLTELGVNLSAAKLFDGSGLSRYNLLNARQLMDLLSHIQADPALRPLLSMLPLAGKSGTLKYAQGFTHAPLAGQVYAKTGTLNGVSNLAGTVILQGTPYLFVMMENGIAPVPNNTEMDEKNKAPQQSLSARILQYLMQQAKAINQLP